MDRGVTPGIIGRWRMCVQSAVLLAYRISVLLVTWLPACNIYIWYLRLGSVFSVLMWVMWHITISIKANKLGDYRLSSMYPKSLSHLSAIILQTFDQIKLATWFRFSGCSWWIEWLLYVLLKTDFHFVLHYLTKNAKISFLSLVWSLNIQLQVIHVTMLGYSCLFHVL